MSAKAPKPSGSAGPNSQPTSGGHQAHTRQRVARPPGSNRPRPPSKQPPRPTGYRATTGPARGRLSTGTWAIGAIAVVVALVVALIAIKVTGGPGASAASGGAGGLKPPTVTPASLTVLHDVTSVPGAVQVAVGTGDGKVLSPPTLKTGQPLLHLGSSTLPAALYIGGEFCPYCAAARWGLLMTFSRFGTFTGVDETTSSPWDVYPATPTFTFVNAHYSSPYVNFEPVEYLSNDKDGVDTHTVLTPLTTQQQQVYTTYDNASGIPFIDIGNKVLVTSAPIDPQLIDGQTQLQVAAQLTDAASPVTEAIVGFANYLTAGVCAIDGQQPGAVCANAGVRKAASALGLG